MTTNEAAARWWAERFSIAEKAAPFERALLKQLDALRREWTINPEKPDGLLHREILEVYSDEIVAPGIGFLFPANIAMEYREGLIWVREEKALAWQVLRW